MKKTSHRYALIMAGGSGTRFWPQSSAKKPKQLLSLTEKKSQLQLTSDRLTGLVGKPNRYVICTELIEKPIRRQLPGIKILAEPTGRNTMAAVCWGAWTAFQKNPDASVVALPADAHIEDVSGYIQALDSAFQVAQSKNYIVCIGIKPTFPATGYGYIQSGNIIQNGVFKIAKFIEKPELSKAQDFLASGGYTWNAGIFVFKAAAFISEVRKRAPEFAAFFDKNISSVKKIRSSYKNLPKISVDVALMEKTDLGALVPGDFGWNDVGSWRALEDVVPSNSAAGLVQAQRGHVAIESHGVIVKVTDKKFVGLVGVENLIVVETEEAILICHKDKSEQVKDLVGLISQNKKLKNLI